MRTIKIIVLVIFTAFNSSGQEESFDYEFINSALRQVDKYDSSYFLLQNTLWRECLRDDLYERCMEDLNGKIDAKSFKEIMVNSRKLYTEDFKLDPKLVLKSTGAHLISRSAISDLQLNKDISRPLNKRFFYFCSTPVY